MKNQMDIPQQDADFPQQKKPVALTFTLLRLLVDGKFHSGETLARQLGVSRAGVSNALRGAGGYGLTLYSVRGRGYCLANPPQWLDTACIASHLGAHGRHFQIKILDSASSSNTLLLQHAAQGAPSGSVLAVEWQSGGRGRMGRTWHSGLGNALTFSLLWRFEQGLSTLPGLSLAVGVALMRALQALGVEGACLKWPNDVLDAHGTNGHGKDTTPDNETHHARSPLSSFLPQAGERANESLREFHVKGGAKLAGILVEAQGDMLGPSAVVIGIGLNLSLPQPILRQIEQPATSLADMMDNSNFNSKVKQGGDERTTKTVQVARPGVSEKANTVSPMKWDWNKVPERNYLLAVLLRELHGVLCEFAAHGFTALRAEWENYHGAQGQPVQLLLPDGSKVFGTVRGVAADGSLELETAQGVRRFNVGEISLRSGLRHAAD